MEQNTHESLITWIQENELDVKFFDAQKGIVIIEDYRLLVIEGVNNRILDQEMSLPLSRDESAIAEVEDITHFLFQFGSRWYYSDCLEPNDFKEFKYISQTDFGAVDWPYLGVHGGFDLCNGSRDYSDWCIKAKFLGYNTLGLCEEGTLGGTLAFQAACIKKGINSIIGETVTVQWGKGMVSSNAKLYVASDVGWRNLLNINAQVNVFNDKFVTLEYLAQHAEGLWCVLAADAPLEQILKILTKAPFEGLFYQIDFAKWDSDEYDKKWLQGLQTYFDKYMDKVQPVLVCDSYYLDKGDSGIRKDLNAIGKVAFKNQSRDQHFKSPKSLCCYGPQLFEENQMDFFTSLMEVAIDNAKIIATSTFKIPIGKLRLPIFEMNETQQKEHEGVESLFWSLIEEGLQQKVISKGLDVEVYLDRIGKESEVIIKGGFISYFLILHDVISWCKEQGIWVGIGRGSAAGCLISYLLDIVKIDPIHYNLLFERFLNESRIKKGLPDIDTDFQGSRRGEVKRYIETKYGLDYVTSIGTYGTFKVKGAMQDLARRVGADPAATRYTTGTIQDDDLSYFGIFKHAQQTPQLKSFIMEYPDLFEKMPLLLNQPKNTSIHAAGMVIVPKEGGTIYDQMPVKRVDGVLVSEWEGSFIDDTGFLKCDILGIKQLDKFAEIAALIEQTTGVKISFDDVNLAIPEVYDLFGNGYNEDVFQFGGGGLKGYCQKLKPTDIEDLIATVALYRPGPIEIDAHSKYILLKNGKERPVYDFGTESITKNTYGIYCYQEQIMQIVQVVGGLSLVEADEVRKAMGKKIPELMEKYKRIFQDGAIAKGCSEKEAALMWDKMEGFAGYAFNRSHAACYAITGYYCQWFKFVYPLQFWTVSLRYSEGSAEIATRLSEIVQTSNIRIASVDINKSDITYQPDITTNSIYWAINSIKYVGDEAVKAILQERNEAGQFFSVEEFAIRMKKYSRQVKKNSIINLVLSGAFDEVENVIQVSDRYKILEKYFSYRSMEIDDEIKVMKTWKDDFNWLMKQKELSGYADIDFASMAFKSGKCSQGNFRTNKQVSDGLDRDSKKVVTICGIVEWFEVKMTKKNLPYYRLIVNDGICQLKVTVWNDCLVKDLTRALLDQSLGKIFTFTGSVADSFPLGSGTYILSCGRELGAGVAELGVTTSNKLFQERKWEVLSVSQQAEETIDKKSFYLTIQLKDIESKEIYPLFQRLDKRNGGIQFQKGQVWTGFTLYDFPGAQKQLDSNTFDLKMIDKV